MHTTLIRFLPPPPKKIVFQNKSHKQVSDKIYIFLKNLYNKSGNIGACIQFIIITQFSAPYSSDNPGDSVYNF